MTDTSNVDPNAGSGAGNASGSPASTVQPSGQPSTPQSVPQNSTPSTKQDGQTNQPSTSQQTTDTPTQNDGLPKPPDASAPAFKVPDEYKDKPWAAKVTSEAEMWKQLANAQDLIGKKTIVPDLKAATPEDREAFYAQLRPKDASEYVFEGEMATPEIKGAVGKMFMENGISAVQGNAIISQYQALGEASQAAMFDPKDFEKTMEQSFGADWKNVTGHTFNTIKGMMTEQDQALIDKLPNAYASLIYRTLGETVKRFGVTEKDTAHFNAPGGAGGNDVNVQRAGFRADMAKLAAGPHTADQMMALRNKLAATYENDPRIQKG